MDDAPRPAGVRRAGSVPRSVWALGLVSLLMDTSSKMVQGLLPVFLVSVLGASVFSVGVIEGIAEATAAFTRLLSGALSDRLGRRKLLVVAGYGLAAVIKPLFAMAASVGWVLLARFLDRVGKGIRVAPRDALIADLAPTAVHGASYGLRQSLDSVGAFAGPLIAMGLMVLLDDDMRSVFWIAFIPAILAVLVLSGAVREPRKARTKASRPPRVRRERVADLSREFWVVLAVATTLTLARFSEAFLVLRASGLGLAPGLAPGVLVVMNVAYAASAYPAGRRSDRVGRWGVLAAGVATLIGADILLAVSGSLATAAAGAALWGLHMGMTQGLLTTLVADSVPGELLGTAFGLFHFSSGVALLAASVLAGWLWEVFGAPAPFVAGAVLSSVTLLGIRVRGWRNRG